MEFTIKIREYFLIPLGKGKMMGRIVIIFAFLKAFMMVIYKVLKFICPCFSKLKEASIGWVLFAAVTTLMLPSTTSKWATLNSSASLDNEHSPGELSIGDNE